MGAASGRRAGSPVRTALDTHDWTGCYPDLHGFCSTDLSAFYFDVRKDAIYCDDPASPRRRAARTVLDILHRCLTAWLAPVLCFTAEEAWLARFPSEDGSIHLQALPDIPSTWLDPALAERWIALRTQRGTMTSALEAARAAKTIGASLQADLVIPPDATSLLGTDGWAELAIVSAARPGPALAVERAIGEKCARCWRVLPEVGTQHAGLCLRCTAVIEQHPTQAAAE